MKGTHNLLNKTKDSQLTDGSWGFFHSLSIKSSTGFTTEFALRALYEAGFTIEDEIIKKSVSYLEKCLNDIISPPDRREKIVNWDYLHGLNYLSKS